MQKLPSVFHIGRSSSTWLCVCDPFANIPEIWYTSDSGWQWVKGWEPGIFKIIGVDFSSWTTRWSSHQLAQKRLYCVGLWHTACNWWLLYYHAFRRVCQNWRLAGSYATRNQSQFVGCCCKCLKITLGKPDICISEAGYRIRKKESEKNAWPEEGRGVEDWSLPTWPLCHVSPGCGNL